MKKRLLLVVLLNLGIGSISQVHGTITNQNLSPFIELEQLKYGTGLIAIGNIDTSVTERIKLAPDTVEFSITYITKGATPNEASNYNVINMKKFNDYLNQLGIKEDNLTTIGYQTYKNKKTKPIKTESKQYQSAFTVNIQIDTEQFFKVIGVLDNNDIDDLKQDSERKFYVFNIVETADTLEKAKQLTQDKYKSIINQLNELGVNDVLVSEYNNQIVPPDTETVKVYYVQNTVMVKVNDFDLVGKVIAKAQEFDMKINNDITYSVSESAKERALEQHAQTIYNKLIAKATRLLGQQYQLGVPVSLSSIEDSNMYAVDTSQSYNYNYYSRTMLKTGQDPLSQAEDVNIQPPSEFEFILTMSGSFEIVKKITTQ